ncbi:hypothetical protein CP532_2059 [Ophiocordyceps camponoti-leonardi (nom. inval.)]|nr:hypothetical protein CP532_2059 [Ophiocordyceps camponoti-leonardi (nom. inval.)]
MKNTFPLHGLGLIFHLAASRRTLQCLRISTRVAASVRCLPPPIICFPPYPIVRPLTTKTHHTASIMDEDLIDYDSDDLMMNDPLPTQTSKPGEVEVMDLKEVDIDTNPPALPEPEPVKEFVEAASPTFAADTEYQQHSNEDLEVPDADGGGDHHITTATTATGNRRESVHEIDYEDDDLSFEITHEANSQLSTVGNPTDATASGPKDSGTSDDKEPHERYEIDWEDDKSRDASVASNHFEGSPHGGGNSAELGQATNTVADRFARLPIIWVQYKAQDYPFFSPSADGFFTDEHILKQPMRDVLHGFRLELSNELEADDELVFQVDKLGLEFSEAGKPFHSSPDDTLSEICLQEVLSIFEVLLHNQDPDSDPSGRVMYTFLFTRPNTMKRFFTLKELSVDGTGLLAAMYTFQPPRDGRVIQAVEAATVSHDDHERSDDPDHTGVDDAKYGHEEQGDDFGDDADYAEEPSAEGEPPAEDEAVPDEGSINYNDEFDAGVGDDGKHHEPEMAGEEAGSGFGDPVEGGGTDVVEAGQEHDYDTNPAGAADDDLIEFTADDLVKESANIGVAHEGDGGHGAILAGDADANDEGLFVDEDEGEKNADINRETSGGVGEVDTGKAAITRGAQYDEDLIDYSDDKLEMPYLGPYEKANVATTDKEAAYDTDFDEAVEARGAGEDAVVGIGDQLDFVESLSLIKGSVEGLAGAKANEGDGETRSTGRHGPTTSDIGLGSTAAGDGLVKAQAETMLEAAFDVDLGRIWEAEDAQTPAAHQSVEDVSENRGTADSSTTATLRDNGEALSTPDDAATTTLQASEPVQLYEIDWNLGSADDGKDDAGEQHKALKREYPTISDGEDGNGMVKRFEAATGSAKVKQTSSVVDPEAAPSSTPIRSPSDGHTRLWEQRLLFRPGNSRIEADEVL